MKLSEARVTIVGLGLIGGSMAAGLRGRCANLVGVDADAETVRLAQDREIVDQVEPDLRIGLEACDLAVLAVPVGGILSLLRRIGRDLPSPKYLLDVGSTKVEIAAAMRQLPPEVDPLGGHPLCGKELSGLSAAEAELFRGSAFVLTPLARSSVAVKQLADELIVTLGARSIVIDPVEHDRLLAATSHLPYLLAVALVACVAEVSASEPRVWEFVASGFRDSTRLAGSDVRMMMDILSSNAPEVEKMVHAARAALERFETALRAGDFNGVESALLDARTHKLLLEARRVDRSEAGT